MNPAPLRLQNLRKRAKRVRRQHAAGYVPVAERIRRTLPSFAGLSDRQVLDAPLSLSQSQQLIARELGFAEWAQLKKGTESMSASEATTDPSLPAGRPEIVGVHPQIFVTDMERAVAFYRDRLGFSVEYLYGEPPFYGLVTRGAAALNLRHVDRMPIDVERCKREDLLAATIVVRNAKPLFVSLKEAGLAFHQGYGEQPWGAHDFIVPDPDGNLLHFASRVGEP